MLNFETIKDLIWTLISKELTNYHSVDLDSPKARDSLTKVDAYRTVLFEIEELEKANSPTARNNI